MGTDEKWNAIVLGAIEYIQNNNKENKIEPIHVNEIEILKLINSGVKTTLKKLLKSGAIKECQTMKGKAYEKQ